MPERIQLSRRKGYRKPEGAVSVTRGTDWGNPFRVGEHVAATDRTWAGELTVTPELAVALFKVWMSERGFEAQAARELHGKDLACWCKVGDPCHADYLLTLANPSSPTEQEQTP